MKNPYSKICEALDDNSFVIFADCTGAKICARLRGATAAEMGFMIGAALASVDRQMAAILGHVRLKAGDGGVEQFNDGLHAGRTMQPFEEGMMIREVPKPEV